MDELQPTSSDRLKPAVSDGGICAPPLKWLSGAAILITILLDAFFKWNDRSYEIPEFLWTLMLAPWFGEGAGKLKDLYKWVRKKK